MGREIEAGPTGKRLLPLSVVPSAASGSATPPGSED